MDILKEKLKTEFGYGVVSHIAKAAGTSYMEAYRWFNHDTDRNDIKEAALKMLEDKKQQDLELRKRLENV